MLQRKVTLEKGWMLYRVCLPWKCKCCLVAENENFLMTANFLVDQNSVFKAFEKSSHLLLIQMLLLSVCLRLKLSTYVESVAESPITTSFWRALVIPTFSRWKSLRNPTVPSMLLRTVSRTIVFFSRPCVYWRANRSYTKLPTLLV